MQINEFSRDVRTLPPLLWIRDDKKYVNHEKLNVLGNISLSLSVSDALAALLHEHVWWCLRLKSFFFLLSPLISLPYANILNRLSRRHPPWSHFRSVLLNLIEGYIFDGTVDTPKKCYFLEMRSERLKPLLKGTQSAFELPFSNPPINGEWVSRLARVVLRCS